LTLRSHRADEPASPPVALRVRPELGDPPALRTPPAPVPSPVPDHADALQAPSPDDVTADLAADPKRTTESYDRVVGELMTLAEAARERWSDDDRAAFDSRVAGLRSAIAHAGLPRAAQHAQGALIRYLQHAIVRDDRLLASGGPQ
jgi:hypothetical protein